MGDAACNAWEKHNSIAHLSCASQTGYERVDHLDLARKQAIKRVKRTDVARSRGQRGRKQISTQIFQNSKSNVSAHTNISLSSKGRESHPHVVAHKCLTKLHATKWQSLSTSRSKGARNKFPSKYFRMPIQKRQLTHMSHYFQIKLVSSHKCLTKLQRKGKPSPPHFTQMSH